MRIGIREQLGMLVLFTTLFAIGILALVTWINNQKLVIDLRTSRLSLTTDLKAAQLTQSLIILHNSVWSISTRLVLQLALRKWHAGNNSLENWQRTRDDLEVLTGTNGYGFGGLLQAVVYDPNFGNGNVTSGGTNIMGGQLGLLNVTGSNAHGIIVPASRENGWNQGILGASIDLDGDVTDYDEIQMGIPLHDGFPDILYPDPVKTNPMEVVRRGGMVMGPLAVNETFFMMSFTSAIINNTVGDEVLGFITVVLNAALVFDVIRDVRGLGETGQVVLVGPDTPDNMFSDKDVTEALDKTRPELAYKKTYKYLFPPFHQPELVGQIHEWKEYEAARGGFLNGLKNPFPRKPRRVTQMGISMLETEEDMSRSAERLEITKNAQGTKTSAGYMMPNFDLVHWVLICEQTKDEVFEPIEKLRNILLGTVFGVTVLIVCIVLPIAHFAVRPITRLKHATEKSTQPPSYSRSNGDDNMSLCSSPSPHAHNHNPLDDAENGRFIERIKNNLRKRFHKRNHSTDNDSEENRRRVFRIPGKVPVSNKIWVKDELSDLTLTYNEMTEELVRQYENLEERVRERTAELEEQKKLAEAANEAKGLFVANISHELRTPLNGILGMAAICMSEDDVNKIKESLQVVYRSGELLHSLLTDLLNFSKNQLGGHLLTLDENEFRMLEIVSQITSIFATQARDANIDLQILLEPEEKILDMVLWGDSNRILQVLINLVSNSLKFTPKNGFVIVRIKLREEVAPPPPLTPTVEDQLRIRRQRNSAKNNRNSRSKNEPYMHSAPTSVTNSNRIEASPGTSGVGSPALSPQPSQNPEKSPSMLALDDMDDIRAPPLNARTFTFEFSVQDSGPGIAEPLQARVFEPFMQGDLRLSKRYGGTGLGLSICAQLTKLMNGSISLDSKLGEGSTFTVHLPLMYVRSGAAAHNASDFSGILLPLPLQQRVQTLQTMKRERLRAQHSTESVDPEKRLRIDVPIPERPATADQAYSRENRPTLDDLGSPVPINSGRPSPQRHWTFTTSAGTGSTHLTTPVIGDSLEQAVNPSDKKSASTATTEILTTPGDTVPAVIEAAPSTSNVPANAVASPASAAGPTTEGPPPPPTEEEARLLHLRVLVAEDNRVNREVVSRMLKLEKIEHITFAMDGVEAVDAIKMVMENDEAFDLVLMDIQMPNMDGIEATRIIRGMGYTAPIVALTAFAEQSNVTQCMEAGMNFFTAKPVKRNEIKRVLKHFCGGDPEDENIEGNSYGDNFASKDPCSQSNRPTSPLSPPSRLDLTTCSLSSPTSERSTTSLGVATPPLTCRKFWWDPRKPSKPLRAAGKAALAKKAKAAEIDSTNSNTTGRSADAFQSDESSKPTGDNSSAQ